jgi:hypothetical protein
MPRQASLPDLLMLKYLLFLFLPLLLTAASPVAPSFRIAKLHYGGGGDWYANKTSLPNLIRFCNQSLKTNIDPDEATVELDSPELLTYPFVHGCGGAKLTPVPDGWRLPAHRRQLWPG